MIVVWKFPLPDEVEFEVELEPYLFEVWADTGAAA